MKKYYVQRGPFANIFSLCYIEDGESHPGEDWERITRQEAEDMARTERWRAQTDPCSSGFGSETIYPFYADRDEIETAYVKGNYRMSGRVFEIV